MIDRILVIIVIIFWNLLDRHLRLILDIGILGHFRRDLLDRLYLLVPLGLLIVRIGHWGLSLMLGKTVDIYNLLIDRIFEYKIEL